MTGDASTATFGRYLRRLRLSAPALGDDDLERLLVAAEGLLFDAEGADALLADADCVLLRLEFCGILGEIESQRLRDRLAAIRPDVATA
jgi:hypothetical protein